LVNLNSINERREHKGRPTQRAPDWWDSSGQKELILRRSIFCKMSLIHARPPAGNAHRWPAKCANMKHPEFGNFTYDEPLGWYEGRLTDGFGEVALYLSTESENEASSILVSAEPFFKSLDKMIASAKNYAADKLLELRNSGWRGKDSEKFSKDEFVLHLSCFSVTLYPDQSVEIVFRDGGLFFGHVVLVSANTQGQFLDATIAG
jgi:hypothetical protein